MHAQGADDEALKREIPDDVVAVGAIVNAAEYLAGLQFPASVADVERKARENGADESALDEIRMLPRERTFEEARDLVAALGEEVRGL